MIDQSVFIVWLIGLSLSQILIVIAIFGIRKRWYILEQRETAFENAERIQRLTDLLQRHRGTLDRELHRAAAQLLETMENDPISRSNHFVGMQILRAKLAAT